MIDVKHLECIATKMTPAADEAVRHYNDGRLAGVAGEPCPDGPAVRVDGWNAGNTKRQIDAGLAIGFVCTGTKCGSCGAQNFGHRLGCSCSPGANVKWGALVDDGLAEGEVAKFMTIEQLTATGLPVLDSLTGKAIPIPAREVKP